MPRKMKSLVGMIFDRLVVLEYAGKSINNTNKWLCECVCGNRKNVSTGDLNNGRVKSCGCLNEEKKNLKHGMSRSKLYKVYTSLKGRCNNPKNQFYKDYGNRGISVCENWLGDDGFINFYNWSIENGYQEGLTIDRIEVDGNYEPDNCRWATPKVQGNNRRSNVFIEINGISKTIAEWAEETGIPHCTLSNRMKSGLLEEDLIKPPKKGSNSGEKYIYWNKKHKKWYVSVKNIHLGIFEKIGEAIEFRDNYLKQEIVNDERY